MKRSEIRQFIENGVNSITPALGYSEGLITNFNSKRSNKYPSVHLLLEDVDNSLSTSAPIDDWKIKLIIAKIDSIDSLPDEYELIVDEADDIAKRLVYKYRAIINGFKLISMESISRRKFVKKYADCLTGIELSFTLKAQDKTNVC